MAQIVIGCANFLLIGASLAHDAKFSLRHMKAYWKSERAGMVVVAVKLEPLVYWFPIVLWNAEELHSLVFLEHSLGFYAQVRLGHSNSLCMTINRTEELAERTVLLVDSKASSPRVRLASRRFRGRAAIDADSTVHRGKE